MKLHLSHRDYYRFLTAVGIVASFSFFNVRDRIEVSESRLFTRPHFRESNWYSPDDKYSLPPETDILTIPLKNAGRLFMIEALVDGQSGNLIFDTGATGLVMNLTYFRKYARMDSQSSNGITGSVREFGRINIGSIKISGFSFTNVSASLADLGHIENRRGVKVLGLIGLEYFRNNEIVIDASINELQLHRIDSKGNRTGEKAKVFQSDISQPVEISKNIIFLKPVIGGKVLRFCFDTGAETNAISDHSSRSVLNTVSVDRKSNLGGAGQKSVEALYGTMNDFVLGGHPLKDMGTIITHLDALNDVYGLEIDGILGYDFLTRGTICINFTKKQLGMKFLNGN